MGLIKAFVGSLNSTLADQWKEYFYCESLPADVLVSKGTKKTSWRSSNTRGSENIISNGSKIGKFQRCPFNVGKPFFRWGYVILSQNKSDLVVF